MHEAIISKDTFEQVQELMKKRTRTPGFNSEVRKVNPYAGIIVCGDCGYNLQRVTAGMAMSVELTIKRETQFVILILLRKRYWISL